MALTAEESAKAAAIVAQWFWQPAEGHNYRFQHATRTLTRYYEAAAMQPDEIKLVIEYLRTQDIGQNGICLLNRTVDFGTGWKAQDAWYQTSPNEKWAGSDSTKIRIYQVLFKSAGNSGDGPYVVEKGCQHKVSHTFYWDVESLPGVPQAESGVEYALQGVVRNKENGLFSCVLEKRERIQQDVAEYVTGETAFETRKDEQHIGVRQGSLAGTGKRASVSRGTVVVRKITKNQDCTSNVQNETTVDKEVPDAVVEYRRTLRGSIVRTVSRNQPSKLTDAGLEVGETRRSEQTDSQLWNNETQKTTGAVAGTISESCDRSEVVHTDVTVENVAVKPSVAHQTPAVNQVVRKEARLTEENTWDVTTSRIVYTPRSTGQMVHGSCAVVTKTTVGTNQPSVPVGGYGRPNEVRRISASPNEHGSYSTTEEVVEYRPNQQVYMSGSQMTRIETTVGKNQLIPVGGIGAVNEDVQISQSINDHGSYDYQQRRIVYRQTVDRTNAGTTNALVSTEIGRNAESAPGAPVRVNEDVQISVQRNDHGSVDYTTRRIRYLPREETCRGGTVMQRETVTAGSNQTIVPTSSPAVNVRDDVSVVLNDRGSFSTNHRRVVFSPSLLKRSWSDENNVYELTSYRNQLNPVVASSTKGTVSNSFSINEHGSYDGTSLRRVSLANGSVTTLMFHCGPVRCNATIFYLKNGFMFRRVISADCERFYGQLRAVQKKVASGQNCTMAGFISGCHSSGVDMAHGVLYSNITIGREYKVTSAS